MTQATYAFVKTANLTVMGGLWAKGATPLKVGLIDSRRFHASVYKF